MSDPSNQKNELRKHFRAKRKEIAPLRRADAEHAAFKALNALLNSRRYVLSYYSFEDEFPTTQINTHLIEANKLLLPYLDGEDLVIYKIVSFESQLQSNPIGFLEPIPEKCEQVTLTNEDLILVPGIAFDNQRHRLGYGKGCYDRFLAKILPSVESYGLGFQDQLTEMIPITQSDVPLHGIFLF